TRPHLGAPPSTRSAAERQGHPESKDLVGGDRLARGRHRTMTNAELRARIRNLVASGDLADVPTRMPVPGAASSGVARPCVICGEADATAAYFWKGGRDAHLHAACDAVWKQERSS